MALALNRVEFVKYFLHYVEEVMNQINLAFLYGYASKTDSSFLKYMISSSKFVAIDEIPKGKGSSGNHPFRATYGSLCYYENYSDKIFICDEDIMSVFKEFTAIFNVYSCICEHFAKVCLIFEFHT